MSLEQPIILTQEESALNIYPRPPILTSLHTSWSGFGLAYMCQPAFATPEMVTPRWHSIGIFTHGDRVVNAERKLDGYKRRDAVVGGDIVVNPANVNHQVTWDEEGDFIILAIETHVFESAVVEAKVSCCIELLPYFSTPDPLVYQIGVALKNILAVNPHGSRLYAETMVNALAVHLMQHYASQTPIYQQYQNGLPKFKLQQIINYINSYLDRDLGLAELAELVQMSPHYFCQLFKQSMGMTPHQYVIRCRIQRAKELLLQQNTTICEVAQMVGFANQSHLNFHFKRLVGTTPKKFLQQ